MNMHSITDPRQGSLQVRRHGIQEDGLLGARLRSQGHRGEAALIPGSTCAPTGRRGRRRGVDGRRRPGCAAAPSSFDRRRRPVRVSADNENPSEVAFEALARTTKAWRDRVILPMARWVPTCSSARGARHAPGRAPTSTSAPRPPRRPSRSCANGPSAANRSTPGQERSRHDGGAKEAGAAHHRRGRDRRARPVRSASSLRVLRRPAPEPVLAGLPRATRSRCRRAGRPAIRN